MNKQDLVAKIAKDAELSKSSASTVVDSFIEGITKALKHLQNLDAQSADGQEPADRGRHQGAEAARRTVLRRHRPQEGRPLRTTPALGGGAKAPLQHEIRPAPTIDASSRALLY